MPEKLTLSIYQAGPMDLVIAALPSTSLLDFSSMSRIYVYLVPSPGAGPLGPGYVSRRISQVTVIGAREVSFLVPPVGQNVNEVPPGEYEVQLSLAASGPALVPSLASSFPQSLRVVAQSQIMSRLHFVTPSIFNFPKIALNLAPSLANNILLPFGNVVANKPLFLGGLMRVLAGLSGASRVAGNQIEFLVDGSTMLQRILTDCLAATKRIWIATWHFNPDSRLRGDTLDSVTPSGFVFPTGSTIPNYQPPTVPQLGPVLKDIDTRTTAAFNTVQVNGNTIGQDLSINILVWRLPGLTDVQQLRDQTARNLGAIGGPAGVLFSSGVNYLANSKLDSVLEAIGLSSNTFSRELDRTWLYAQLGQNRTQVVFDVHNEPLFSYHQKLILIDDVAYVIGMNLAPHYVDGMGHPDDYSTRPGPPWHDTGVRVRGPVVADIEAEFIRRWDIAIVKRENVELFGAGAPAPASSGLWAQATDNLTGNIKWWQRPALVPLGPFQNAGSTIARFVANHHEAVSGQADSVQISEEYEAQIQAADTAIYIENQFLTDLAIVKKLLEAGRRLEIIRIVLPHPLSPYMSKVYAYLHYQFMLRLQVLTAFKIWLKEGASTNEYELRGPDSQFPHVRGSIWDLQLENDADRVKLSIWNPATQQYETKLVHFRSIERTRGNIEVYHLANRSATPIYVHSKLAIFLNELISKTMIIGSYNLNRRSRDQDSETALLLLDDALLASSVEEVKTHLTADPTIDLSQWNDYAQIRKQAPATPGTLYPFSWDYIGNEDLSTAQQRNMSAFL